MDVWKVDVVVIGIRRLRSLYFKSLELQPVQREYASGLKLPLEENPCSLGDAEDGELGRFRHLIR